MADELELLTENEAGDSWVDSVPGEQVTTGYQSQNTNVEANRNGIDSGEITFTNDNLMGA